MQYGCSDGATSFTGALHVNALSGTIYTNAIYLEIEVIGALGGTSDFNGGTASADPFLFIPSTFPDAGTYSIEVSPQIGNVFEAVPESATWAMMLVGFAALAGLRYHRVYKRHRSDCRFGGSEFRSVEATTERVHGLRGRVSRGGEANEEAWDSLSRGGARRARRPSR
jgi:hypothetical protein